MNLKKLNLGKLMDGKVFWSDHPIFISKAKGLKLKNCIIYKIDGKGRIVQVQNSKFNNEITTFQTYLIVPNTPKYQSLNMSLKQNKIVTMYLNKFQKYKLR